VDPEALTALHPLLGLWRSTGHVLDDAGTPGAAIAGTDGYELMDGGRWIVHRVDVVVGGARTVALELIGGADDDGVFTARAFDASGRYDEMRLSVAGGDVLRLTGDGMRSTLCRHGDDTMTALWEREADGGWVPWMQMRFDRIG